MWWFRKILPRATLYQRPSLVVTFLCCIMLLLCASDNRSSRRRPALDAEVAYQPSAQQSTTHMSVEDLRISAYNLSKKQIAYQPTAEQSTTNRSVEDLRIFAYNLNKKQEVHHEDKFGALGPADPVIVVQVHDRGQYLSYLLHSLSQVQGIERALLVLSHDHYDAHILHLAGVVTFCKMMQIFFTYSTQLYPHEFPGVDPNDCPRNIHYEQARKIKCNNADFPDQYGHYRESSFTQIKHHWWWKLNVVMEKLNMTRDHEGPILLLEEDYYVAPDYLAAVWLLLASRPKLCGTNMCLCMVGNVKNYYSLNERLFDVVDVLPWTRSRNNMGIIMTRDLWKGIRGCFSEFCTHDDYNWDLTLTAVAKKCFPASSLTVSMRASRIFHIGGCGVHYHRKECPEMLLRKARQAIPKDGFGSEKMSTLRMFKPRAIDLPKASGGWADVRDHRLCVKMTL